jgi:hypothetical protein
VIVYCVAARSVSYAILNEESDGAFGHTNRNDQSNGQWPTAWLGLHRCDMVEVYSGSLDLILQTEVCYEFGNKVLPW